jgi:D-alanyl-D-alanine carboxypeptidase/D-alanyl-D-alanine-endopeptidase (penicillin-binding protein 4)
LRGRGRLGFHIKPVALVLLVCCAVACPLAVQAAEPVGATPRLTKALRSPYLSLGRTAALAVSLQTGQVLYSHNESLPVLPASNEKVPVSWAALVRLGPGFRFHTDVVGTGALRGSTWDGDLVLKGYGDPTLGPADLDRLAARIHAVGIRRVSGRVLGDESFFDQRRGAPGWKRGFVGLETPPLSALVVDRARGWPALSPPLLAARALTDALARRGVSVVGRPGLGRAPAGVAPIVRDHSRRLRVVVHQLNRDSDNFSAEMLLKQLGTLSGRVGTSARGGEVVVETMAAAGIPVQGVRIVDGSGLSRLDRLTAAALVGVLRAGFTDPRIAHVFVDSMAVAARNGTLHNRLWNLRGVVKGKTGTTNLACTLSGYVGSSTAFAVLQNGDPVASWAARAAQDRFVTLLASSG